MNLAGVAVKNAQHNRFRTVLTILGVAVAILAFILLRTVLSAWTLGARYAAQDRVATRHKVTFLMMLPTRYVEVARGVQGVEDVTWLNWFGGRVPGREEAFFANLATDPESFFRVYDEVQLPEPRKNAWLENRRGAIVGRILARQFGWNVGDRITLRGTLYPGDWEFHIEGIYTAARHSIDESSFFFHWDYLNESNAGPPKDQVGWLVSRVGDASQAAAVSKRIDAEFEDSDIQTLSMSERALNASFLGMLATMLRAVDIVSGVILLIMMLIVGNTIAMGVRERTHEYGVLRAIGFMPRHIATFIIAESATISAAGALLGIALAVPLVNQGVGSFMEETFTAFFPYFRVMPGDAASAFVLTVALGATAGAIPAYQAAKLEVTHALRRIG